MREQFIEHRFNDKTLDLIAFCADIIAEYQAQGGAK